MNEDVSPIQNGDFPWPCQFDGGQHSEVSVLRIYTKLLSHIGYRAFRDGMKHRWLHFNVGLCVMCNESDLRL